MLRLAAQHLLPGPGDDVELVPRQIDRRTPPRWRRTGSARRGRAAIQSPFGTATPEVVPFQVKTTSRAPSTCARSGSRPYSALSTRKSASFSCLATSVTHCSPKLSQASMSTPRAPSSDHIAISMAPVSDAGTMPRRQSAGRPRIARERSITSRSFALPGLERCERPSKAPASAAGDQPGRLAQGPDEKHGLAGRTFGRGGTVMIWLPSLQMGRGPSGGRGPRGL